MKRFHVHVSVSDIPSSVRFYAALFGGPPTVEKPDYAKWMLEDPRVNFAISRRDRAPGVNHLGFQTDSPEELSDLEARLKAAAMPSLEEKGAACCYAKSDKTWVEDPQGVPWEVFHTLASIPVYGESKPAAISCCQK
jgi:catechol 2,3-dioxygenase-like lactoylglutathione lyase family enzyme